VCGDTCAISNTTKYDQLIAGISIFGNVTTDNFQVGSSKIAKMPFLLVMNETGLSGFTEDGMMGLNAASFFDPYSHGIMYYMYQQSIITSYQFGIYLSSNINDSTSQLTLGGYDTIKAGNLTWFPMIDTYYWTITLNKYSVGSSSSVVFNGSLVITSGLSYSAIPRVVYTLYTEEVKKKYSNCMVYADIGLFGCPIKDLNDINDFPDLHLMFDSNKITIPKNQLVFATKSGSTFYGIMLLVPIDSNLWLLGTNFMRGHYIVYNYDNKTIGISNGAENLKIAILLMLLLIIWL
jgi:hypothetical protein